MFKLFINCIVIINLQIRSSIGKNTEIKTDLFMLKYIIFLFITEELTDSDVVFLSGKIVTEDDLMKFGIDGLKLSYNKIRSTLTNHPRDIQSAVHDVLQSWLASRNNRFEAMTKITVALESCGMNRLLCELRQHVEGAALPVGISADSTYHSNVTHIYLK